MCRLPPRSPQSRASAASDVYKRQVLRPQFCELVVTQRREDTLDVLPVAADGGLRQLAGSDVRQPQVDVFCQRELLDGLRRVTAFPLEQDGPVSYTHLTLPTNYSV